MAASVLPAQAQSRRVEWNGSRGGRTVSESTYESRPNGGLIIRRESNTIGPNGGASQGNTVIRTDGNGNTTFRGGGEAVGPRGNVTPWGSEGSGRINANTGRYEGQRTTTINGRTYNSSTENGRTTVTGPDGQTRVYTRPWAR
ncbi:MAG: hypothetical protein HC800_21510 [Phormidesmis sp. RL_2_1]|nr:hypothetical protein [Phormidesmis sp. RL_2_1]